MRDNWRHCRPLLLRSCKDVRFHRLRTNGATDYSDGQNSVPPEADRWRLAPSVHAIAGGGAMSGKIAFSTTRRVLLACRRRLPAPTTLQHTSNEIVDAELRRHNDVAAIRE
jgi:hypothetical protein